MQPPGYDRLLISREGEDPEIYSLYKRGFTIGRSQGNDIVLVGSKVSRWHARLSYSSGKWHIADIGSTNGTLLDERKLALDEVQVWPVDQIARVGPFFLRLETPAIVPRPVLKEYEAPARQAEQVVPERQAAPAYVPPPVSPREVITADIRPRQIKGSGLCRVLLLNRGEVRTTVMVSGSDPYGRIYFDGASKQASLSPGQKGVIDFFLEVQKRPLIGRRQSLPFTIHVNSNFREWERLEGELVASPMISIWLLLLPLALILALVISVIWRAQLLP